MHWMNLNTCYHASNYLCYFECPISNQKQCFQFVGMRTSTWCYQVVGKYQFQLKKSSVKTRIVVVDFVLCEKKRSKTLREQFIQLFNSMLFHASIGIESFKGPLLTTIIIYTINHVLFLWQNKTKLTMFDKLLDSVWIRIGIPLIHLVC